ncbi:heat shock protein 70 A1-like [Paramacrobiotus metropolitanus]|uniref:heat shock protein 70 A1-like n=1 Tax=Paramacrobiotus metropolitanus TaxID=2943436 RepID=UPI0024460A05|nr:heat shock protein 70 A1-like [Paramacrobiotus metropolitanus]
MSGRGGGLGIDLGTTHCCVYVVKYGCQPEPVPNSMGGNTIPSWVRYEQIGHEVGSNAKEQSPENATSTVYNAKRIIGRKFEDDAVQNECKRVPFVIDNDNGSPIIRVKECDSAGEEIYQEALRPEKVSATLLEHLRKMSEEFLGELPAAVITVPANFTDNQRSATMMAAKWARFGNVTLLNEPTAAAIAYASTMHSQGIIMVIDFGGGTLDVTIMKVDSTDEFKVLTTDGNSYLGGEDFDKEIVEYFLQDIHEKYNFSIEPGSSDYSSLKLVAEKAKICLSSSNIDKFRKSVFLQDGKIKHVAVLPRSAFDGMFLAILKKLLEPVTSALTSAGLTKNDIDKVVLVGGSTRLPAVKRTLQRFFERNEVICTDANPDEAIAKGAALLSYRLNNNLPSNFVEITAYHYGLELDDPGQNIMELIPRGISVPCSITENVETAYDNQTAVRFTVFQSKLGFRVDKYQIGYFEIWDLPARKAGECKFTITYRIDESTTLHAAVQGKDDLEHYKKNIEITLSNRV